MRLLKFIYLWFAPAANNVKEFVLWQYELFKDVKEEIEEIDGNDDSWIIGCGMFMFMYVCVGGAMIFIWWGSDGMPFNIVMFAIQAVVTIFFLWLSIFVAIVGYILVREMGKGTGRLARDAWGWIAKHSKETWAKTGKPLDKEQGTD